MEEPKRSKQRKGVIHNWAEIILIYIISRLALIIIVWQTMRRHSPLPLITYLGEKGILWAFTAYDSQHYLAIAQTGYTKAYQYAFFPMYSQLINIFHFLIGISGAWAGVLISNLSFIAVLIILDQMLPAPIRRPGLLLFALNPITIFEMSVYTEALFLALCLAVWFLYQRRCYWRAGIILGLTINTRNIGVLMAIPILVDWWEHQTNQRSYRPLWQGGLIAAVIGSLYPVFQLVTKGNLFFFIEAQKYWHRQLMFPLYTLWLDITRFSDLPTVYQIQIFINFFSLALVIYLCLRFWLTQKPMVIFLAISTLIPLLYGSTWPIEPATISLFRYIYASFPLYFLIPLEFTEHRNRYRLIQAFLIFLMVLISILFVSKLIF